MAQQSLNMFIKDSVLGIGEKKKISLLILIPDKSRYDHFALLLLLLSQLGRLVVLGRG